MARSIETIKAEIKVNIRTYESLDNFLFPEDGGNKVGVFNVIIYVVSAAIHTFEVLMDALMARIKKVADSAAAGNSRWLQAQILNFQYGYVIVLENFVPKYDTIDEDAKIITQCSVKDLGNGITQVKVAKGDEAPYSPLTTDEMTALKNYYYGTSVTEGVGFAGGRVTFVSLDPDRIYIDADIYFYGQYVEADVKADVISAIDEFLKTFSESAFDGTVYMIRLVDAIQGVDGVNRVYLNEAKVRPALVAFAGAVTLDIQGAYNTVAGHIISEDTAGQTLQDRLTMIQA